MLIAPCSAATLGKLANGVCDTALVTVALALPPMKPLLIAPAMDTEMWVHPSTQRNCAILRKDGAYIIPPAEGELASGFVGAGRLPEVNVLMDTLFAALNAPRFERFTAQESFSQASNQADQHQAFYTPPPSNPSESFDTYNRRFDAYATQLDPSAPSNQSAASVPDPIQEALGKTVVNLQEGAEAIQFDAELELTKLKREQRGEVPTPASTVDVGAVPFPLAGKTVLITAGPTYEKIDDVRFIGNYSSGKMGFALAEEAARFGAKVTLVAGPVSLQSPENVQRVDVESAREMFDEVMKRRAESDVIILAAAVADFTPVEKHDGKIKKEDTGETMTLRLTKTPDILAAVGAVKGDKQIVVGFALEAHNHVENARKKLTAKRADMIVLNALGKPQSGFDTDENTITILTHSAEPHDFAPMPKRECARVILREAVTIGQQR
jgi:phosphopantothenoylcysteine decarboxylase/phosphopantothenate--cysteine ligase